MSRILGSKDREEIKADMAETIKEMKEEVQKVLDKEPSQPKRVAIMNAFGRAEAALNAVGTAIVDLAEVCGEIPETPKSGAV